MHSQFTKNLLLLKDVCRFVKQVGHDAEQGKIVENCN